MRFHPNKRRVKAKNLSKDNPISTNQQMDRMNTTTINKMETKIKMVNNSKRIRMLIPPSLTMVKAIVSNKSNELMSNSLNSSKTPTT